MSDMTLEQRIEALEGRVATVETKVEAVAASVGGEGSLEPGYGYGGVRPPTTSPVPGNVPDPVVEETPAPEVVEPEVVDVPTDITAEEAAWVSAVAKIQEQYGMSADEANSALIGVLVDHDQRGVLWTAAVEEIVARDNVSPFEANRNLQNLLASLS